MVATRTPSVNVAEGSLFHAKTLKVDAPVSGVGLIVRAAAKFTNAWNNHLP